MQLAGPSVARQRQVLHRLMAGHHVTLKENNRAKLATLAELLLGRLQACTDSPPSTARTPCIHATCKHTSRPQPHISAPALAPTLQTPGARRVWPRRRAPAARSRALSAMRADSSRGLSRVSAAGHTAPAQRRPARAIHACAVPSRPAAGCAADAKRAGRAASAQRRHNHRPSPHPAPCTPHPTQGGRLSAECGRRVAPRGQGGRQGLRRRCGLRHRAHAAAAGRARPPRDARPDLPPLRLPPSSADSDVATHGRGACRPAAPPRSADRGSRMRAPLPA
jgi:hypothetical protein